MFPPDIYDSNWSNKDTGTRCTFKILLQCNFLMVRIYKRLLTLLYSVLLFMLFVALKFWPPQAFSHIHISFSYLSLARRAACITHNGYSPEPFHCKPPPIAFMQIRAAKLTYILFLMSIPKVNHGILFLFIFGLAIVSIIFLGKTPFLDAVYLYNWSSHCSSVTHPRYCLYRISAQTRSENREWIDKG